MKPALFNTLNDIPEGYRNDYKLVTDAGSPNFNKYVLDLDPQHPVAVHNVTLVAEKRNQDATHQTAIQQKDAEIQRLAGEVTTAKATGGLPAGHVAIPQTDLALLQTYRTLGDPETIRTKVTEHGTLKEQTEAQARKDLYSEIAKSNGLDEGVFADLAEPVKLNDLIETRETTDDKGVKTKQYFVKAKDDKGADTLVAVADFVKNDEKFKKFEKSLFLTAEQKEKIKIPNQSHGDPPAKTAGASAYINRTYKKPETKTE